jgi:hypothetical protein
MRRAGDFTGRRHPETKLAGRRHHSTRARVARHRRPESCRKGLARRWSTMPAGRRRRLLMSSTSKKPKLLEAGHPDNFQTPGSAIECLLPYLPKEWLIWEPACGKGNLVRAFEEQGYKVYGSDIAEPHGKDFLHVDCKVRPSSQIRPSALKRNSWHGAMNSVICSHCSCRLRHSTAGSGASFSTARASSLSSRMGASTSRRLTAKDQARGSIRPGSPMGLICRGN